MTTYTPEEIATVISGVSMSGMAVAIADLGVISTAIEATAMAKEIAGAAEKYPNNPIIQSVFNLDAMKQSAAAELPKDITPENAVDQAIAAINAAVAVLNGKGASAADIQGYQAFIYACADRVANAAGSGLFGSGSPKVSPSEAAALAKLKAALGA